MTPARDSLRIGDQEREHAAALLAEHFAQGRLTHGEYAERFDAVWTARTQGDLRTLFHDLPGRASALTPTKPRGRRHGFHAPGALWLVLAIVLVVLAVKTVFALIFALIPLLVLVLVGVVAFRIGRRQRRRRRRLEWYDRL